MTHNTMVLRVLREYRKNIMSFLRNNKDVQYVFLQCGNDSSTNEINE